MPIFLKPRDAVIFALKQLGGEAQMISVVIHCLLNTEFDTDDLVKAIYELAQEGKITLAHPSPPSSTAKVIDFPSST